MAFNAVKFCRVRIKLCMHEISVNYGSRENSSHLATFGDFSSKHGPFKWHDKTSAFACKVHFLQKTSYSPFLKALFVIPPNVMRIHVDGPSPLLHYRCVYTYIFRKKTAKTSLYIPERTKENPAKKFLTGVCPASIFNLDLLSMDKTLKMQTRRLLKWYRNK